jgi:hypothetical protein
VPQFSGHTEVNSDVVPTIICQVTPCLDIFDNVRPPTSKHATNAEVCRNILRQEIKTAVKRHVILRFNEKSFEAGLDSAEGRLVKTAIDDLGGLANCAQISESGKELITYYWDSAGADEVRLRTRMLLICFGTAISVKRLGERHDLSQFVSALLNKLAVSCIEQGVNGVPCSLKE